MTTQKILTYGDNRSPIRAHFQNIPITLCVGLEADQVDDVWAGERGSFGGVGPRSRVEGELTRPCSDPERSGTSRARMQMCR